MKIKSLILAFIFVIIFSAGCSIEKQAVIEAENSISENDSITEPDEILSGKEDEQNQLFFDNPMLADFTDSKYDMTMALSEPALKDVFDDYFKVGVAINGNNRGNTTILSPEMSAIMKYHFNSTVYSNLMKSGSLLDHKGSADLARDGDQTAVAVGFNSCIPGLEFAKENGLVMRGHTLIWHTQVPEWFFKVDYNADNDFVDKETMLARMENFIKQVLEFTQENYPGVVYAWDVVNEAVTLGANHYDNSTGWYTRTGYGSNTEPQDNLWYKTIGADYVEKAFEYARKYAAPGVKLFYNDYNTFDTPKTDAIVTMLEMLIEKDLVDGVGMQSTFGTGWPSSVRFSFMQALEKFGNLGIEIHMTETTVRIPDDSQANQAIQAAKYKELFDVILETHVNNGGPANITNVTFFGLMDKYMFYSNHQEYHWLFDKDLQPKPAYYSILEAIEAYNT